MYIYIHLSIKRLQCNASELSLTTEKFQNVLVQDMLSIPSSVNEVLYFSIGSDPVFHVK